MGRVKLAMLGGGGFRTPLVYRSLMRRAAKGAPLIDHVALYDLSPERLAAIDAVLRQLARSDPDRAPRITTHTGLPDTLDGADFVFSAIRVGGLDGRVADERVALDLGVLGQETTGPGGVAFGLRTIPEAVRIARDVAHRCPDAWVINFTNPAGMITEAMQRVLGDRVIGVCDSPMGLSRRAHRAVGLSPTASGDYLGLNHLGWLLSVNNDDGVDELPGLLADPATLATFEEGQVFGAERLAEVGALPNEYLYYYWFTEQAIADSTERTRGEYLLQQQRGFYAAVAAEPDRALDCWNEVRTARNASYMADARGDAERDDVDVDEGGYEEVAVDVMEAIAHDRPTELIVNVANRGTIADLADDRVVEVPCLVSARGATPVDAGAGRSLTVDTDDLVGRIKHVEQLAISAALERSVETAVQAFADHPLVESTAVASQLFDGYRTRIPEFAAVFA